MGQEKSSYYQFHKNHDYSVFLKFDNVELERKLLEFVNMLGFEQVKSEKFAEIKIDHNKTKILHITLASAKVMRQINEIFSGMENYGDESLSSSGNAEIYRYRKFGVMVMAKSHFLWQMAVAEKEEYGVEFLAMLTRYLSFALAQEGVLGLWGVSVDEGFVVMRPNKSHYECSFFDLNRNVIIGRDGDKKLDGDIKVLRLDAGMRDTQSTMSQEMLLSFLSTHTTYFSYKGLHPNLKLTILELASIVHGIIYPEDHFRPRSDLQLP